METVVLGGIGAAALGYMVYLVWRAINGKDVCNCGSNSCHESAESCRCKSGNLPK
ncbi:MAG TPA: hypothetical protein PKA28_03780 [Methylomusa anaerophila]|uniref:Uncharacterized protein n=1 Tax=Methylomusa anaerophila TaxID=1930071 RepID=A0A348ANF0_9FIRM|nr:hypothetical protein [Methylomusa anaerophila]BBB92598.1 hypothetical protein MAMMFC1_03293 [Methylomusa anaerophila]HML87548.1 hypothetical protein [Methylomusa anaerophila]